MEDAARSNMPSAAAAAARSSLWQEAHMDILDMVLRRASSLPDSARAAAVCRAWRHAVVHLHPPLPPQLPWLLLPDLKLMCSLSSDGSTAEAHRLPHQSYGTLPVCIGSTGDGRVILLKDERSFVFLNPLSGATTSPLPDLHLAAKLQTTFSAYPNSSPLRKVVVSSSPGSAMIAGIQGHTRVFLCRPGAATWFAIKVIRFPARSQSDIAFHNGKLYLFSMDGYCSHLLAIDIQGDADGELRVTLAKPFPGPPSSLHGDGVAPVYYLTESRGRLVVVRRDLSSYMERRTRAVTVFALNESTSRPEWERMGSLGGEIMFLSATSSVSVPSSRHRGDRVYFSQEEMDVMAKGCTRHKGVCPHHHCEVFDTRTRTAETLCTGTTPGHERWCYGSTWFVPSHQPKHANAN